MRANGAAIALACSGLGRVERGYEKFISDIATFVSPTEHTRLYKGGSAGLAGTVLPNLPRQTALTLGLTRDWEQAYRWEQLSFALGLAIACKRRQFDVVHFLDLQLAAVLARLRPWLGFKSKLLFTNCAPHSADVCGHVDFMQVVTPLQRQEAFTLGFPPERIFTIPMGIAANDFEFDRRARAAWRQRLEIPPEAFVVLTLANLSKRLKRIDWLSAEIGAARQHIDNLYWVAAGARSHDSDELEKLAKTHLGERLRFLTVASDQVPSLISCADLAVLASLQEGFGLAVVETCAAGVATLVNDHPHFRWLIETPGSHVDMTRHGPLAATIASLASDAQARATLGAAQRQQARARFDWSVLRPQYAAMYAAVAAGQAKATI